MTQSERVEQLKKEWGTAESKTINNVVLIDLGVRVAMILPNNSCVTFYRDGSHPTMFDAENTKLVDWADIQSTDEKDWVNTDKVFYEVFRD